MERFLKTVNMAINSRLTKWFTLIVLVIYAEQGFVQTGETDTLEPEISKQELVAKLATASFNEKLKLVDAIEQAYGAESLLLLNSLKAGELYFDKNQQSEIVRAQKNESETYVIFPVDSQRRLKELELGEFRENYKKIRVNNRLRKKIKLSVSRIILESGSKAKKVAALNELMGEIDDSSRSLIESLYGQESPGKVKDLMSVVLAVHTLNSLRDSSNFQFDAIDQALPVLEGRLERPVKTALVDYRQFLVQQTESADETKAFVKKIDALILDIEEEVEFYLFIEKLFFGLSLGSVLLLAAIGLAITFGVMGVINMAHGEMIMLGAYTTYVVQLLLPNLIEYSLFIAIPAAFLVAALVGMLIQRLVIRYLHGRPLETLLATFGVSLILRQAVRTLFTPLNRQVNQPSWMSGALDLNPVLSLTYNRLYILVFSLLVFIALVLVIKKTWLGLKVRAVSQNRAMAKSMGVKTDWVDALTFALGSGVAGVAGVALSQLTNVGPNLGQAYIIDSFMVVVFGGVGNLMGTLVASFSLGVANKFMEPVTGAVLANILVLVFIILFIQKRPKGLFPQRGRAAE